MFLRFDRYHFDQTTVSLRYSVDTDIKIALFLGGPSGATEQNIEEYMEKLQSFATENKNILILKQAQNILNKIELPLH